MPHGLVILLHLRFFFFNLNKKNKKQFLSQFESVTMQDIFFFSFNLNHMSFLLSCFQRRFLLSTLISPLHSLDFCSSQVSHSRLSDSEVRTQFSGFDFGFRSPFFSVCVIDRWTPTTALTRTATNVAGEPFLRHNDSLGF